MRWWLLSIILLTSCGGPVIHDEGDPDSPDGGTFGLAPANEDGGASTVLTVGETARVTADSLNLRDGVGTGAQILTAMPCGASVLVVGGPSTTPAAGWWNVTWQNQTGWASGKYLTADASFDPTLCGATATDGGAATAITAADIFARAKLAVGYSYYWGHGSWRADMTQAGSCMGSCPSCTHSGQYGADCSGFVAKAWQVPTASALEVDEHPYSTANFYNDTTHWRPVPRSTLQPADALVHRDATSGHIVLVESTQDPFGDTWVYEARGCATGVVHDLRTLDSSYIAIRREGF
ncbi:MAG: SH3 domain-containing protein [Polyangia bacterium]